MPGTTPVYGLPYPTMNDLVDPATFCNLANAIDALMAGTNALVNARLQNTACRLDAAFAQNVAVNVETALTWQATVPPVDNSGMFSSGAPTITTVRVAGVYLISISATASGGSPVDTGTRLSLFQNGLRRFSEKRRGTNVGSNLPNVTVFGAIPCLVGDTLDVRLHWTGSGGPTTNIFSGLWHLSYVCPV
jgi:hypothetical protein